MELVDKKLDKRRNRETALPHKKKKKMQKFKDKHTEQHNEGKMKENSDQPRA